MKKIPMLLLLPWLIGAVLLLSPPSLSQATSLTNTDIDDGTDDATPTFGFDDFAGAAFNAALVSSFDFDPATAGGDGEIISQVFRGIGPASGLLVYTYQIRHFATTSSEAGFKNMSLDFLTDPTGIDVDPGAGVLNSFFIGTAPLPAPPGAPFTAGTVAPGFASWTGTDLVAGTLDFGFFGVPVLKGETSFVVGTFSPNTPTTVIADLLDTGDTITSPSVYSPGPEEITAIPEPTSMFLLGVGLAGMKLRRRKKVC